MLCCFSMQPGSGGARAHTALVNDSSLDAGLVVVQVVLVVQRAEQPMLAVIKAAQEEAQGGQAEQAAQALG